MVRQLSSNVLGRLHCLSIGPWLNTQHLCISTCPAQTVLLQLTYHAFGSEELRAAIEGARRPGRQPSHQVDPNDSEAIRFLKGGGVVCAPHQGH